MSSSACMHLPPLRPRTRSRPQDLIVPCEKSRRPGLREASRKFVPAALYRQGCELDSTRYEDGNWTFVPCPWRGPGSCSPSLEPCSGCGKLKVHGDHIIVTVMVVTQPVGAPPSGLTLLNAPRSTSVSGPITPNRPTCREPRFTPASGPCA